MNDTQLAYQAAAPDQGAFLRDILASKLLLSHALVIKLKYRHKIKVNGQVARTDYRVKAGDLITVDTDLVEDNRIIAEPLPLHIVYQDPDFLAVNKPAGMSVHPSRPGGCGTLANAVTYYWRELGINSFFRPINRLDRDTSGLVLIAKSQFAHQSLFKQQQGRLIERRYIALVEGQMAKDSGRIEQPIARPDPEKRRRAVAPLGKAALTHYQVLERHPGHTLLALRLETGRTHQIRVHLSFIGHPVCGDLLYGCASPLIDRQALHAANLRFTHPRGGREIVLAAPLPDDIQRALAYLREGKAGR